MLVYHDSGGGLVVVMLHFLRGRADLPNQRALVAWKLYVPFRTHYRLRLKRSPSRLESTRHKEKMLCAVSVSVTHRTLSGLRTCATDPRVPRGDGVPGVRYRGSLASIPVRTSTSIAARDDDTRAGHSRCAPRPGYSLSLIHI